MPSANAFTGIDAFKSFLVSAEPERYYYYFLLQTNEIERENKNGQCWNDSNKICVSKAFIPRINTNEVKFIPVRSIQIKIESTMIPTHVLQ